MSRRFITQTILLSSLFIIPAHSFAATVEERLDSLEQQFKQMNETAQFNNKRMAAALANFEQVMEEMTKMRGEIEKVTHLTTQDMEKRASQLRAMEHRLARMEERLADLGVALKDLSEVQEGKEEKLSKKEASRRLYQKAFSEMTQRRYKLAIQFFGQFIKRYPKSSLADNAQYWKAECFFALGDFETAVLEFQKVIQKYPKGNKAAAAILKQAYSFVELKAYADAKAFLEKVIAEYPRSEEAIRAREKMVEVGQLIKEETEKKP